MLFIKGEDLRGRLNSKNRKAPPSLIERREKESEIEDSNECSDFIVKNFPYYYELIKDI